MITTPEEAAYFSSKRLLEDNNARIENGEVHTTAQLTLPKEHIERYFYEKDLPKLRENYDKIIKTLKFYSDLNPHYYNLVALWIIGTYLNESFEVFPYLFINAMRGSGKTRLLKLITALARDGQLMASMTEAVLFRTQGTLGIDEFENLGSKDKNELRELLNAAYKKGIMITRMRKKKTLDGEQQVAEGFSVFRPIVMANIWGMEEVLGDRCISLQLEKSSNPIITRLVENFNEFPEIKQVKTSMKENFSVVISDQNAPILTKNIQNTDAVKNKCSLCSVVTPENIYSKWNEYIYTLYTLTTQTTLTTLTTQEETLFKKIVETNIDGRNLELFFPLFLIAEKVGPDILGETLDFAKKMVRDKKVDEITESKDVLVFKLISVESPKIYIKIQDLVAKMRLMTNEGEMEWLNAKWMGRALKRLNLIVDKRRVGDGIEVTLNIEKAKEKMEFFNRDTK